MSTPEEHNYHHAPDKTELEKWLTAGLEKIEPYANQILIGFIVVTLVAVGLIYASRSSSSTQSEGWAEYVTYNTPDDFAALADDLPTAPVSPFARLQAGRLWLQEGINSSMTNRENSNEQLHKAQVSFEKLVIAGTAVPPEVRSEALYGLAMTLEASSDGSTDDAVKAYQKLVDEFENSTHTPWAKTRISELETEDAQQFYAWYHTQDPKPTDRPKPQDIPSTPPMHGLPELNLESDDSSASGDTELKGPSLPVPPKGTDDPKKEMEAPREFPKEGDKPKEETPATDKPQGKPAPPKPEEKPADKPAEKPEAKPEAKPESKPEVKPEAKPEEKPAAPEEPKPEEPKPEATPEPKTEPAAEEKPAEPAPEESPKEE